MCGCLLCGCRNLQLIQSHVAPSHGPPARVLSLLFFQAKSLLLPKPCGKGSNPNPHGPLSLRQSCVVLSRVWLLRLGLNPNASLPLQPHFRLLLQSVTPASIPIFFQLYWAATVSLGRCGPMTWSQSSSSSHAGSVIRGSCFPVTYQVEVTPISLAQSIATAI